jgi:hypothetical protein
MPPRTLEDSVVNKLKADQMIKTKSNLRKYLQWAASVAVIVALFLGGMFYERLQNKYAMQINPQKGYILLLHEDKNFKPGKPEEMYKEYGQWMRDTYQNGVNITGQELKDLAVILDGAEVSRKESDFERTTGYFILEATDMEHAIEIAQGIPHLKYGGKIEVKPFMNR